MSLKFVNNSLIVMLSFMFWMVTDFGNAGNVSSEPEHVQQADNWSRFSFVLHIFLPMAGLVLFFQQKHIISKLLLQLDRNCVSVLCPSFSKREKLLKWAGGRLPDTWSSHSRTLSGGVPELWSDGSLLCTLINTAIPGACPNPHRHWKKPPLHAQALAYKYLGVVPIFTENDLSSVLTVSVERNFLHYLNELQQAIVKQTEKTEVTKSISSYYIARGMGLYTGEQHRKTVFYVYLNIKHTRGINSNIIVHIRGPYGTYGKAVIPKFHNELFTIPEINVTSESLTTRKLLQKNYKNPKNSFMKNLSLPFMQYHKKHMGDNIIIHVTIEDDRAKVTYIPKNYGMYEINMVSNGELIMGCPFNVHILNNSTGVEDNFENEEKKEEILNITKRKIISKTIDFIDEKMPMADLLRKYKSNEEKNEKKDEMNYIQESNNPELRFKEVNATKESTLFTEIDKLKTALLPSTPNTENKNELTITHNELNLQNSYHKKEIFKSRHNERKIDDEVDGNLFPDLQDNINIHDNEVVPEAHTLNENLKNLERKYLNSRVEDRRSHFLVDSESKTDIHNHVPDDDKMNILQKQNSESFSENYYLDSHDENIEENIHNVQADQHLNILEKQNLESVIENHKSKPAIENQNSNLQDDKKVILKNNILENFLEKENLECIREINNSNLHDNKNESEFNNGVAVENPLEKQNVKSTNENHNTNLQATVENNKKIERILDENKQIYDKICKVNDCGDKTSTHKIANKDAVTISNLEPNKISIASVEMSDEKNLVEVETRQRRQDYYDNEDTIRETKFTLNKQPIKFCVNKIRIPEKFCAQQNFSKTNSMTGLDTKYFKNAINSSNKMELPRRKSTILHEDDVKRVTKTIKSEQLVMKTSATTENKPDIKNDDINNNKNINNLEVKRNLVKSLSQNNSLADTEQANAIPRRFFQIQEPPKENSKPKSPPQENQIGTSTICPVHIVPEVENEFSQMSVAEKRKIFTKQSPVNVSDSTNSSFSENENAEGSKNRRHFRQYEGLSVLNYLGSLKQSQNSRTPEHYSLCSTVSLPNINSVDSEYIFQNSVKARKTFWENMSSSSSSLSINTYSPTRKPRKLTEHERCRLIWQKPNETPINTNLYSEEAKQPLHSERMSNIYKSADDILSMTSCIPYQRSKKYKSLDNSLDNCTMLSIDERKKMLLKQNYEKEKIERDKFSTLRKKIEKMNGKNMNKISEEINEENKNNAIIFSPVLDKIKKYDSAFNLTNNPKEEEIKESRSTKNSLSTSDISENYIHNDLQNLPQPQKLTIKSHFKRAISYFKNLEEKSLGMNKSKPLKNCRRYSLDIQPNKYKNNRRGGSLNLINVSERFSINNLYTDVCGNKKGSFKGAANQSALVEALATFSRKENNNFNEEDENDIKYNIFKRKAKSKKRISVRSIFDVYY